MNYQKVYNQIVEYAKNNPPQNYKEQHHIIPKAEGGSNDKSNIVKLSARQHYIAHLLLAKIYDDYAMYSALTYMQCKSKTQKRYYKFNSRLFEKLRLKCAKKQSQWRKEHPLSGKKNGMYGRKHSEESKKKMSNAKKGQQTWLGRHHTEEAKKKIREKLKGRHMTTERLQKHKQAMARPEVRAKLSLAISKSTLGSFWVTDGRTNRFLKKGSVIPDGFNHGRTIKSRTCTGYRWYNDGKTNVFAKECPDGFVKGRFTNVSRL